MRAVKAAEHILFETQDSKSYLGPEGDLAYVELLKPYVFGAGHELWRAARRHPDARRQRRAAARRRAYPRGEPEVGADVSRHADLAEPCADPHRPQACRSSATPISIWRPRRSTSRRRWRRSRARRPATSRCCTAAATTRPASTSRSSNGGEIAAIVAERKIVPFIDLAYQGLGDGLEEDAAPMRLILEHVDEALVAYSCDKNFGLYRDRVGALYVLGRDEAQAQKAASNFTMLARVAWSMPPDHGAALVRIILREPGTDEALARGTRRDARPHQRQPRRARRRASEARLHPRTSAACSPTCT